MEVLIKINSGMNLVVYFLFYQKTFDFHFNTLTYFKMTQQITT